NKKKRKEKKKGCSPLVERLNKLKFSFSGWACSHALSLSFPEIASPWQIQKRRRPLMRNAMN
ncbi:MAG TPA: hypothetical protein VGO47_02085, partial [Chlamydiales bacterium]|nr:hypothetical protein [Chlamydiales bacterium]